MLGSASTEDRKKRSMRPQGVPDSSALATYEATAGADWNRLVNTYGLRGCGQHTRVEQQAGCGQHTGGGEWGDGKRWYGAALLVADRRYSVADPQRQAESRPPQGSGCRAAQGAGPAASTHTTVLICAGGSGGKPRGDGWQGRAQGGAEW